MDMKKPAFILKLRGSDFLDEELSCSGSQVAKILKSIKEYTQNYDWYIFDVMGTSHLPYFNMFPKNAQEICIVQSTDELIDKAKKVIQFESGVFAAVKKEKSINWDFNYLPETEESEGIQHPLVEIEIRLFDFSYIEVYGIDMEVQNIILNHMKV
jgi:hypothetical protein